jgi:hypothetical protein
VILPKPDSDVVSTSQLQGTIQHDRWRYDAEGRALASMYAQTAEAHLGELMAACRETSDPKVMKAFGKYRAAYEVVRLLTENDKNG